MGVNGGRRRLLHHVRLHLNLRYRLNREKRWAFACQAVGSPRPEHPGGLVAVNCMRYWQASEQRSGGVTAFGTASAAARRAGRPLNSAERGPLHKNFLETAEPGSLQERQRKGAAGSKN